MKSVFGYLRVSGRGQVDKDGFDRQRQVVEDYCTRKGWKVIRWFQEEAVSGEVGIGDRPEFAAMLEMAGPGTATTVVMERADRLARTLAVTELACAEARACGVEFIDASADTELTNSDDPTRVMVRQLLGMVAEWNKNVLVQRLRKARERKRLKEGRCEGYAGREEKDPETWRVLMECFDRFAAAKLTLREMSEELRRLGIPTFHGKPEWSKNAVNAVKTKWAKDRAGKKPEPRETQTVELARPSMVEGLL